SGRSTTNRRFSWCIANVASGSGWIVRTRQALATTRLSALKMTTGALIGPRWRCAGRGRLDRRTRPRPWMKSPRDLQIGAVGDAEREVGVADHLGLRALEVAELERQVACDQARLITRGPDGVALREPSAGLRVVLPARAARLAAGLLRGRHRRQA